MSTTKTEKNIDLLNILADGEDEFDVDLMACGCRLAAPSIRLDAIDAKELEALEEKLEEEKEQLEEKKEKLEEKKKK